MDERPDEQSLSLVVVVVAAAAAAAVVVVAAAVVAAAVVGVAVASCERCFEQSYPLFRIQCWPKF